MAVQDREEALLLHRSQLTDIHGRQVRLQISFISYGCKYHSSLLSVAEIGNSANIAEVPGPQVLLNHLQVVEQYIIYYQLVYQMLLQV